MIWTTWRQHRPEALAGLAAVAGAAALLLAASGQGALSSGANAVMGAFVVIALGVLPAVAGVFLGAPLLARDLEQGTWRLVWTQGTTRGRWLATELALAFAAVVPAAALLGALTAAVVTVPQQVLAGGSTVDAVPIWNYFDVAGPALAAYIVFAFSLGIAAGALVGRSYPAMAIVLAVYIGVRSFIVALVRPNYLPPLWMRMETFNVLPRPPGRHDSLFLYFTLRTASGRPVTAPQAERMLGPQGTGDPLSAHGIVGWIVYQPGDRWWLFQGIEAAIYVVLAVLLVGLTFYWVTRRLA